jgi:hypothetical protein
MGLHLEKFFQLSPALGFRSDLTEGEFHYSLCAMNKADSAQHWKVPTVGATAIRIWTDITQEFTTEPDWLCITSKKAVQGISHLHAKRLRQTKFK